MVELPEIVGKIPGFSGWSHPNKIAFFGWYLHTHRNRDRFDQAAIRWCYEQLHTPPPSDVSVCFAQMLKKKPPQLLKDARGYRLEGRVRQALGAKYGESERVVTVTKLLSDLPGTVPDDAERDFLREALICYRNGAFRAAVVMVWILAYDHLAEWLLGDAARLASFNASLPGRLGGKRWAGFVLTSRDDFEELKEFDVIQICSSAGLITGSMTKVLEEKLRRRNSAAHPSALTITQVQADDMITDLVNNVIRRLV